MLLVRAVRRAPSQGTGLGALHPVARQDPVDPQAHVLLAGLGDEQPAKAIDQAAAWTTEPGAPRHQVMGFLRARGPG